jgi:hypothetical protein
MIVKSIWFMIGYTIWSLRNILTIFELLNNDCMKNTDSKTKFLLINFYFFTIYGYLISLITIILIPGAALYHCYK